jgi:hypothetical protein
MIVLPSMPLRNANMSLVYHGQHFSADECEAIIASTLDSEWCEGGAQRCRQGTKLSRTAPAGRPADWCATQ